ncbi:MAG: chromosomal replication initiator protein DnaA [Dehalococcoidia bacterium]|nr:chromosomal replication initiator protein DnaA [Dehalococcoidia bacterium]
MNNASQMWEAALGELQLQVTKANYETWLKDTVGLNYEDKAFVVGVPNSFTAAWLQKCLYGRISGTISRIAGQDVEVELRVSSRDAPALLLPPAPLPPALAASLTPPPSNGHRLNSKYIFDNFIIGSCNRLAYAAAMGVAESPGKSYNPLFIYGSSGLGKTHLLHAIGHVAVASGLRLLYVSAEQFTNEFIDAIAKRKTEDFRLRYRSADMLLVDDIHFIGGKEQTEEAFFHTFNELHNAGRQIAITSDRPPKAMPLLEDRLRSRFEWGLIADIQPPDLETRLAILRTKAELQGATISAEVLEFIAQRVQENIRQLEGALNRVIAYARLTQTTLTPEVAARAMSDILMKSPRDSHLTADAIVEATANYYKLSVEAIRGQRRDQDTAQARHVAMYLIREETHASLAEIGRELGGRDHTTVLYGCDKIGSEINIDSRLRREVLEIRRVLYPSAQSPGG